MYFMRLFCLVQNTILIVWPHLRMDCVLLSSHNLFLPFFPLIYTSGSLSFAFLVPLSPDFMESPDIFCLRCAWVLYVWSCHLVCFTYKYLCICILCVFRSGAKRLHCLCLYTRVFSELFSILKQLSGPFPLFIFLSSSFPQRQHSELWNSWR